jgi:hypothetical protein
MRIYYLDCARCCALFERSQWEKIQVFRKLKEVANNVAVGRKTLPELRKTLPRFQNTLQTIL